MEDPLSEELLKGEFQGKARILVDAVKDVAGAIGGLATELFEIRDASRRAMADHADEQGTDPVEPVDPGASSEED